jgi:hypothetical protein
MPPPLKFRSSTRIGPLSKTLTVLYDIDLLDEEEESEEASLAESWQPRHRR